MISRSLSKPIGDARSALNPHWGPAAIAEHGHRRPAISGYWLDARVRVDRSNLFLQREGAATVVVGIHLNESADVLERLANGLMRRDEDPLRSRPNRVQGDACGTESPKSMRQCLWRCWRRSSFARRGPARLFRRIEVLVQWLAAFCYSAERGGRRGGVIVNAKYLRACTLAEQ